MARIACLLSQEEMVPQAWRHIEESGIDWRQYQLTIDHGPSYYALEWAQKVQRENVDIIIARGLQATYIKRTTKIPLVDIRLTGQEMGLLISHAKAIVDKKRPLIGVVGYKNQFCDMDYFDEIFDIDIHQYRVENEYGGLGELRALARRAIKDGVDVVIGGDTALEEASAANVPGLYLSSTGDSFMEAFRAARQVAYAIELEKSNAARLKTILDNSFSVIISVDDKGRITLTNHIVETLLNWNPQDVIGRALSEVMTDLSPEILGPVLRDGREVFSRYIHMGNISMMTNIAPIKTDSGIIGAIISAQKLETLEEMGTLARQQQYKLNRVASEDFDSILEPSRAMRHVLETSRLYAKSDAPVLITSEPGNSQERIVQAIHNDSSRKGGPFVRVNCADADGEAQSKLLFGSPDGAGLIAAAHGGSAYLENIQNLAPTCQHRLLSLLRDGVLLGGDMRPGYASVRVIACGDGSLPELVAQGQFLAELYYMLNTLPLTIPPLRERPDDILFWADCFLKHYRERYKRYITLTEGGRKQMCRFQWNGNIAQLKAFCQSLILSTQKRTIDEVEIQRLFLQMYPITTPVASAFRVDKDTYQVGEAELIRHLMRKHNGNRGKVAAEIGISTTTLWRRMKKLAILDYPGAAND